MSRRISAFRPSTLLVAALLALVWLPFLSSGALAQTAEEDPVEATPAPAPEEIMVPPELSSARATMRTFLEAFDPEKAPEGWNPLDRAAFCLDLSSLDENLRVAQGRVLAAQLKEVLDRTALIDFATIPNRPTGDPWALEIAGEFQVVMAPDDAGRWLFSQRTVERLPEMLRAVQDKELVEGVADRGPLTMAQWIRGQMSPTLLSAPFILENWQWLALVILVFAGVLLDRIVTASVHAAIQRYLAKRMEQINAEDLHRALRPLGLLIASLVWWPGLFWLGLPINILKVLVVAVKFVAITAFVWAAYRMVDIIAAVFKIRADRSENKFDDLLVPLFRKSTKIIVAALGFIFIADNLDVDITSLVAGVGIGGLALALAAQDAVKNLFGSLMVILDRPFSVGDWVVIGDVEGSVLELGFRSTRIKTFYDSTITLPNANLIDASVDNLGARTYRRWKTMLSLTYDTPADKVEAFCEGVRELIRLHPYTRKDSFQVYLNQFSASSIDVLLYMFFKTPDWAIELQARHRLALDIMRLAQELEVEFAFPTQTLYLQKPSPLEPLEAIDVYGDHLRDVRAEARAKAQALVEGFQPSGET